MINLIPTSTLKHFGLERTGFHWSPTCEDIKNDIAEAIQRNQMLVIAGEVGAGKSVLFEKAAENIKAQTKFIYVRNYYKENCTISSIINAAVYDLSDERPRHDLEARSRQFIKIVGEQFVKENWNIVLIIEEAHRLHRNTLRALKELREASFAGKSPLFSVVLIGHPELMERVSNRREVLWRSQALELDEVNYMTFDERMLFLRNVFKSAISNDARKTIALLCKQPLHMMKYVGDKMRDAKRAGYNQINSDVVQPTTKELVQGYGLSYRAIARESNLSVATVSDAINMLNHKHKAHVEAAIKALVSKSGSAQISKAS